MLDVGTPRLKPTVLDAAIRDEGHTSLNGLNASNSEGLRQCRASFRVFKLPINFGISGEVAWAEWVVGGVVDGM